MSQTSWVRSVSSRGCAAVRQSSCPHYAMPPDTVRFFGEPLAMVAAGALFQVQAKFPRAKDFGEFVGQMTADDD